MKSLHKSVVFLFVFTFLIFVNSNDLFAEGSSLEAVPPSGKYKKVSTLVELPDYIPGLGELYVDPSTLPAGPFLAYDRDGKLVSTIYMVPLKDLNEQKSFENLNVGQKDVDHVDLHYNAGHPGVPVPHYHIILWYISSEKASNLK